MASTQGASPLKSTLLSEHVGAQVGAGHRTRGKRFDVGATLSRDLAPCSPVADHGLANAKRASKRGNATKLVDCFVECFHAAKYHAPCLSLSTHFVFVAEGSMWVNT